MAIEIQTFAVTIPAGTAINAPQITNIAMPTRVVRQIDIVVPPGPNGVMGFALTIGGNRVYPINANAWVIASGEVIHFYPTNAPTSGAWQVMGYNTGNYSHTIQLRFHLDVVEPRTGTVRGSVVDIVGLTGLSSAPELPAESTVP